MSTARNPDLKQQEPAYLTQAGQSAYFKVINKANAEGIAPTQKWLGALIGSIIPIIGTFIGYKLGQGEKTQTTGALGEKQLATGKYGTTAYRFPSNAWQKVLFDAEYEEAKARYEAAVKNNAPQEVQDQARAEQAAAQTRVEEYKGGSHFTTWGIVIGVALAVISVFVPQLAVIGMIMSAAGGGVGIPAIATPIIAGISTIMAGAATGAIMDKAREGTIEAKAQLNAGNTLANASQTRESTRAAAQMQNNAASPAPPSQDSKFSAGMQPSASASQALQAKREQAAVAQGDQGVDL